MLSAAGAVAGVAIAALALRQIATATRHIAPELPFWISFRLSPVAVLYAGVLSVLAAAIVVLEKALGLARGNPAVVLLLALFMMAVGFLAALGPARRCLGIEPTEALREQ